MLPSNNPVVRPRTSTVSLAVEALEDRMLPSTGLGQLPLPQLHRPLTATVTSSSTVESEVPPITATRVNYSLARLSVHVISAVPSGSDSHTLTGVRLTFDRSIDASTLNPDHVHLTGPGGANIPLGAIRVLGDTDNRVFDLAVDPQTAPGTYTWQLDSGVRDMAGGWLTPFQTTHTLFDASPDVATFSSMGPTLIPRQGGGGSLLNVDSDMKIGHLSVRVNITYPHDRDLYIHLQGPRGQDVLLVKYAGGSNGNFRDTVFDDDADNWALFGKAPFSGTYQPMVSLDAFTGQSAQGLWKLWVENHGHDGDTGVIDSWSLTIRRA
jgi:subtilisin-like proprotein convertase family protein